MYLFYENKNLKAVFDDISKERKKIAIYIVKYHIKNGYYNNNEEAIKNLKKKFIDLFAEDLYFMESFKHTWFIKNIEKDKIYDEIKLVDFNTRYTTIKVKGSDITKKDLSKNIPMLDLNIYYN